MLLVSKVEDLNIIINLGDDLELAQSVANMFEHNVQYVRENWGSASVHTAKAGIVLADSVTFGQKGSADAVFVTVTKGEQPVGAVPATAEAFIELGKLRSKYEEQVKKLQKDLQLANEKVNVLQAENDRLQSQLVD